MRKSVDISDKFDSASETEWMNKNWELAPHTMDVKFLLKFIGFLTLTGGVLGGAFYFLSAAEHWRNRMDKLYTPYESAVVQIQKLEYSGSESLEKKGELARQRDEAWQKLCAAERSRRYIRELRNLSLPYQACD